MATNESEGQREQPEPLFVTTHWSVVLAAGQADSSRAQEGAPGLTRAARALSDLCETYWYPLYAYARRRGYSPEDAQDLTQEFFARLLEGNWISRADRQRGRFRSFLLSAMKHFLANEWNRAQAQKRGGGQRIVSLDDDSAEGRYRVEPAEKATPETLFERRWALTLLETVLARLEEEYRSEGKETWIQVLRPGLMAERAAIDYTDIAQKLAITETAARVSVHRLRQRYRQLIRAEIATTVGSEQEIDDEMRHLFEILTKG